MRLITCTLNRSVESWVLPVIPVKGPKGHRIILFRRFPRCDDVGLSQRWFGQLDGKYRWYWRISQWRSSIHSQNEREKLLGLSNMHGHSGPRKFRACWNNGITTYIALHAFEACLWTVEATAKLQLGRLMGSICMSLQVNGMGNFWFSPFQASKKMNPGYIWSALTLRPLFKIVLLFFHVWQLVSKHQVRVFRSILMLHSKNDVQKATRK